MTWMRADFGGVVLEEGGQTPTRESLREKRKQGIIDREYSYLLFFNQLTVKGSREVVARGENGVMRGFSFVF